MAPAPDPDSPVAFVRKVGRGKTLSQDLSPPEARAAFSALLDGAFTPAQFGAFLQALRIKELTQDELDALAGVAYGRLVRRDPLAGSRTLVLNLASDTARKGGLASVLALPLLRRLGVGAGVVRSTPVLSGNRKSFDAAWEAGADLEAALGSPAPGRAAPPPVIADCAELLPGLPALDRLRGELGFRSCLHTLEKLVNPWPGSPVVLGISHPHYALRMARTMVALGLSGKIIMGNHGTPDLVLHKETALVAVAGEIREETIAPAALGLELTDVYSLGKLPLWREWVAEGPAGPGAGLWRVLHYHVAFLLWAAGAATDPAAGLAAARAQLPTFF